ncbi:MAG TPA: electron transporter RnfC, partial [Gammaproteobacteria bacterium]|nr:electron transporter RnfC [Gammaproteobacteria bacterium]
MAKAQSATSAPVHAPTSGTIIAIGEFTAPHPSGLLMATITLEADGADQWIEREPLPDPFALDPAEVARRVGAAGIVGMGGANFPSAVKLDKARQAKVHTLVINGAECEPYMSCDDRLMRERAAEIADGVAIMLHAVQAAKAVIAIEDNKPEALAAMRDACQADARMEVRSLPSRYPAGSAKQLIQWLTGLETPAGGRGTDTGLLV